LQEFNAFQGGLIIFAEDKGRRLANQRIAHGFKLLDMAQQRWRRLDGAALPTTGP